MTFHHRPAVRESTYVLLGLAGSSGSGKTYSALRLATGLAGGKPFGLIDTENGRALHYADQFKFEHGELREPFTPAAYAEAIKTFAADGCGVIVVDSTSHEWSGDGGLLDWHEQELQRMAGDDYKKREAMTFSAWVKPKMAHKKEFVNTLLSVKAHVILCFRAEEKIKLVKNAQTKKMDVLPPEWTPITEKNLPYEMTLSFLLTADAPGIPKTIKLQEQHKPFVDLSAPLDETAGEKLAKWAAGAKTAGAKATPQRAEAGGTSSGDDGSAEAPAVSNEELAEELQALADAQGVGEAATQMIEAKQGTMTPPKYRAWLLKQIEAAKEAAA